MRASRCPCCNVKAAFACDCNILDWCHRCHKCRTHCKCEDGLQNADVWWKEAKTRLDRAIEEFEENG